MKKINLSDIIKKRSFSITIIQHFFREKKKKGTKIFSIKLWNFEVESLEETNKNFNIGSQYHGLFVVWGKKKKREMVSKQFITSKNIYEELSSAMRKAKSNLGNP